MNSNDPPSPQRPPPVLVEHYFRHEYGRLVSALVRKFGPAQLETVEDAVQSALTTALTSWALNTVPKNPGAWLHRVAHNQIIDILRRSRAADRAHHLAGPVLAQVQTQVQAPTSFESTPSEFSETQFEGEISDDTLRMLVVLCDPNLQLRTQLILALKILCGFSVREIALRLFDNEEAIYKRISRGRNQLQQSDFDLESPSPSQIQARLSAVHQVLYLLFNEGYSSSLPNRLIRAELCQEALRLTHLLADHPQGDTPESWALLALMHFHHARIHARTDGSGTLLLLEEQDRRRWDREEIHFGLTCLMRSGQGDHFSRYHAEAAVLAEHCLAPTYEQTRWSEIVDLYQMLESITPSPLHTLNRAIATAEWKGPEAGLEVIESILPPSWIVGYYLWDATLGELHRRAGDLDQAKRHLTRALEAAPTLAEQQHLRKRLASCN